MKISSVICSLLHLFRAKGPVLFGLFSTELICLMQDLVHMNPMVRPSPQWPVIVERFSIRSGDSAVYLTPTILNLSSYASAQALLVTSLTVLTDILQGLFFPREVAIIWDSTCFIMSHGSPRLKAASMVLLTHIVTLGGFPEDHSQPFSLLICIFWTPCLLLRSQYLVSLARNSRSSLNVFSILRMALTAGLREFMSIC